jgi:predicted amidohydrolase
MRLACVQSNVVFGDPISNAERAIERLRSLKVEGVDLAVFPEAYLTGYCVSTTEEACGIAIAPGSEALQKLQAACDEIDILAIVGFAESVDGKLYNSAVLLEPGKAPRTYRKTHLPELGLDKFVEAGQALPVFDTRLGKIGILICFDLRPPEATRVLALAGAELIVLPTNWPVGAEISAAHIGIARAAENRVFVATCNRVGEENGFRFIGQSKIIDLTGKVIAAAGDEEEVIMGDIDLSSARQKRMVAIPGKYETEVFASRNPRLYSSLLD